MNDTVPMDDAARTGVSIRAGKPVRRAGGSDGIDGVHVRGTVPAGRSVHPDGTARPDDAVRSGDAVRSDDAARSDGPVEAGTPVGSGPEVGPGEAGSPVLPAALDRALSELAARPQVLVAVDFDGVLAPIVADPDAARPLPEASAALSRLADSPGVRIALVSGRTLADLRRLARPPAPALLVGSHGAQFAGADRRPDDAAAEPSGADPHGADPDGAGSPGADGVDPESVIPGMDQAAQELLVRVTAALDLIAQRHPGTFVERKPAGAVLHTRRAPRNAARRATEEALAGPSTWRGVRLTRGKEVVDLSVVEADKGGALTTLRGQVGLVPRGGGVLYLGDDITDERAFAVLDDERGDVTVKVGEGTTIARHRVDDPEAVAAVLARLADLRRARAED